LATNIYKQQFKITNMKKITLLFALILSVYSVSGQIFSEDFSSGVPPTGWTIDGQAANWSQYDGAVGGGTAPKAHINWEPRFNGTSRLVSPTIDLTGETNVVLSFEHLYSYYGGPFSYGVATRSGGGAWNIVWTAVNQSVTENRKVLISNSDVGQSDFQFCFFFTGDSYNINDILLDDIILTQANALDAEMVSIDNIPFFQPSNQNIEGTITNQGYTPITSYDVTYNINNTGDSATYSVTGVNIPFSQSNSFVHNVPYNFTTGTYNVVVTISNINGQTDITDNNTLNKEFGVASQSTINRPLFELFTSSSCGPCAGFNGNIFNPFMAQHNDITVVKYQSNGPSPGDPYYTPEVGVRSTYYGQNGVPQLYIGATDYAAAGYVPTQANVDQGYNNETSKVSFFAPINPTFSINGNEITVNANITPYISGNFKVFIAVVEKTTTGNVGSNGETSFEHVMMKMLPDASGEEINFSDGISQTVNYTFDMSSTFVEEMNDLAVAVFVQHEDSKIVMQSGYVDTASVASVSNEILAFVKVYPNPTTGILNIKTDREISINITDMLGRKVYHNNQIINNEQVDLSTMEKGMYIITLSDGKQRATQKIVLR